ncbi:MAG: hypothetical protein CMN21_01520 [Rubinisphaera sp.]|uniref:anti-sigma factor family protein n=1 Tax=Rubinisphaera sp. TaxID=2024857 RepID=UPI000C0D5DBB|nr:zf-HC2 domain-containing protein [Rubinisphaera sp.]MBV07878.1 hypothetical protein [Rubinisphaera sp.]|tara:strand:+ start:3272 stop:4210 length:939 start_codon:yes stop_codon:yes gene_type:complete
MGFVHLCYERIRSTFVLGIIAVDCREVQMQLSAYHDGQLIANTKKEITAHLAECSSCAAELVKYEKISTTFSKLPASSVPDSVWEGISNSLDGDAADSEGDEFQKLENLPLSTPVSKRQKSSHGLILIVSLVLLIGVGFWFTQDTQHSHDHHSQVHHAEFAETMTNYLNLLETDPDQAQGFLMRKYGGRVVSPEEAVKFVGYRPVISQGLPAGYTLESTTVLTMPCCTCVKSVCRRTDGSTIVVFEHDDAELKLLGERESQMTMCGNQECCLVNLDSSLAASWKAGSRLLTVVGIKDESELSEFVRSLKKNS